MSFVTKQTMWRCQPVPKPTVTQVYVDNATLVGRIMATGAIVKKVKVKKMFKRRIRQVVYRKQLIKSNHGYTGTICLIISSRCENLRGNSQESEYRIQQLGLF